MAIRDARAGMILVAAGSVLVAAGCAPSAAPAQQVTGGCALPTGAVAIAASGRANSPHASATPAVVAAVDHAIASQSHLAIIDTGGQPAVAVEGALALTGQNEPARVDERARLRNQVGAEILAVQSRTPEANPLEALSLAARTVKANGHTGTIVLADSGLQTTGALDYTKDGLLLAEPRELAEALRGSGLLPDLTGITVALTGIGDTVAPQQPLDERTRATLTQQWVAIAEAAGATCVHVDPSPNASPAPPGVPAVAEVAVPAPPAFDLAKPLALREDVLDFKDNSAELVDPEQARTALAPLVAQVSATSGAIRLTGTSASGGTPEGRQQLSLQRAEAAKALLVSMGVAAERISTEGVGTEFPEFEADRDEAGVQIPEIAARNRSVILVVEP